MGFGQWRRQEKSTDRARDGRAALTLPMLQRIMLAGSSPIR
jgi:hypothetical protein